MTPKESLVSGLTKAILRKIAERHTGKDYSKTSLDLLKEIVMKMEYRKIINILNLVK